MDQRSGHCKMDDDALKANTMHFHWGGKQRKIHSTIVADVGKYIYHGYHQLNVGDIQDMIFTKDHPGPFNMSEDEQRKKKHTKDTGKTQTCTKTKSELITELCSKHGIVLKKLYTLPELQKLAKANKVQTEFKEKILQEGWIHAPKGLLQVLFERKMIDRDRLHLYSVKGKIGQSRNT